MKIQKFLMAERAVIQALIILMTGEKLAQQIAVWKVKGVDEAIELNEDVTCNFRFG